MTCPICKRPTVAEHRPFCSKRCADVDLGKWLSGSYAIPSADPLDGDDLDEAMNPTADRPVRH
jgi:endogenous inhibitor of DNA gyrase (YacG/DUF329 family)